MNDVSHLVMIEVFVMFLRVRNIKNTSTIKVECITTIITEVQFTKLKDLSWNC